MAGLADDDAAADLDTVETALAALSDFQPLAGRGQTRRVAIPGGAFTLIDESYNANPLSMAAGFKTLGGRSVSGRRVVVLTDMLELGDQSRDLHEGLGRQTDRIGEHALPKCVEAEWVN